MCKYSSVYDNAIGKWLIETEVINGHEYVISIINFSSSSNSNNNGNSNNDTSEIIEKTKKQLDEYFKGLRMDFDLPLYPIGTGFQQKVWGALGEIPYGETRTYGEIAKKIGCSKGQRAVGMANNRNPIAIIIPCHRVIGAKGNLVGYAGGLEIKEALLKLEESNKKIYSDSTL